MKLLFALIFFSSIHAQTSSTKALFFDLPIDKTKSDVVNTIKADTALFRIIDKVFIIDGKEKRNSHFLAEVKKYHTNLPKPFKYPSVNIVGKKFYRGTDTLPYKSYQTITLMLTYKRKLGSFKNAETAFSSIIDTIKNEYKIKLDDDPFVGKNKTTFKDNMDDDFRCSIEIAYHRVLKNHKPDKAKCLIYLTYRLQDKSNNPE